MHREKDGESLSFMLKNWRLTSNQKLFPELINSPKRDLILRGRRWAWVSKFLFRIDQRACSIISQDNGSSFPSLIQMSNVSLNYDYYRKSYSLLTQLRNFGRQGQNNGSSPVSWHHSLLTPTKFIQIFLIPSFTEINSFIHPSQTSFHSMRENLNTFTKLNNIGYYNYNSMLNNLGN